MRRSQFDHVIAAAANATGLDEFVVIGSQAILGSVEEPPPEMLESMEVDLYPRQAPDRVDEIDGAMGDGSWFEATYGYFAHGVGPLTAKAPAGWEERLVTVKIPARVGSDRRPVAYCLEPHDLVLAKCVRGDERDWDYARAAIRHGVVDRGELLARVQSLPVDPGRRGHIEALLARLSD